MGKKTRRIITNFSDVIITAGKIYGRQVMTINFGSVVQLKTSIFKDIDFLKQLIFFLLVQKPIAFLF